MWEVGLRRVEGATVFPFFFFFATAGDDVFFFVVSRELTLFCFIVWQWLLTLRGVFSSGIRSVNLTCSSQFFPLTRTFPILAFSAHLGWNLRFYWPFPDILDILPITCLQRRSKSELFCDALFAVFISRHQSGLVPIFVRASTHTVSLFAPHSTLLSEYFLERQASRHVLLLHNWQRPRNAASRHSRQ